MSLLAVLLLFAGALEAEQYRAFWADAFHKGFKNPADIELMLDDVTLAKANALFVQMRRRGDTYFLQSLEPPAADRDYAPNFDALEYLIERAHARGIEVHAWFVVGPAWTGGIGNPPDPRHVYNLHGPSASGDDMWLTIGSRGEASYSLDLGHPAAARYLADVILEPVKHYGLDGIHLDYIRYPEVDTSGRSAEFGWNPRAVERFQRLVNRTARPEAADPAWGDFRRQQVTSLVRQIYLRAYALRPSLKVSAALITWGDAPASDEAFPKSSAFSRVFQDWRAWLEEGILDLGIPMNYFAETRYSAWLDRWLEFEKDRQFGRAIMPGLGIYLSSIPDSLSQIKRVLAPSAAGNRTIGVNFYSYASTNILSGGVPTQPNPEFYRALGDFFAEPVPVPELPWKAKPDRGHVYGWLEVEPGPAWLKDGAGIRIESETAPDRVVRTATDGTGFFGVVDLPPDRYHVRIERAGQEIFRTTGMEVTAGSAVLFHMFLKPEDFSNVVPRLDTVSKSAAAPGDLLVLSGANLAAENAYAQAAPLPLELGGAQVVVNGTAAALFYCQPNSAEIQLPFLSVPRWRIMVRRAGLESRMLEIDVVPAAPKIMGARRVSGEYLEIYATGLGLIDAATNCPAVPVTALLASGERLEPLYAGLAPGHPGLYQVNVRLPDGMLSGQVRLQAGDSLSEWFAF